MTVRKILTAVCFVASIHDTRFLHPLGVGIVCYDPAIFPCGMRELQDACVAKSVHRISFQDLGVPDYSAKHYVYNIKYIKLLA